VTIGWAFPYGGEGGGKRKKIKRQGRAGGGSSLKERTRSRKGCGGY